MATELTNFTTPIDIEKQVLDKKEKLRTFLSELTENNSNYLIRLEEQFESDSFKNWDNSFSKKYTG